MKSPSIPPFPTRTERFSTGLGAVLIALNAFTLAGWWLELDELLQPLGVYAPIKINAALSFGALGVTLLATAWSDRRFAAIAVVPLVLGLAAVAEHLFGYDL